MNNVPIHGQTKKLLLIKVKSKMAGKCLKAVDLLKTEVKTVN